MTGDPKLKHGPQPYEAVISTICEAFGCLPDEAERQNWSLVKSILEYRSARDTLRIERDGSRSEKEWLAAHPDTAASLKALYDAQRTIYADPSLTSAIEVYRQAEQEEQDR